MDSVRSMLFKNKTSKTWVSAIAYLQRCRFCLKFLTRFESDWFCGNNSQPHSFRVADSPWTQMPVQYSLDRSKKAVDRLAISVTPHYVELVVIRWTHVFVSKLSEPAAWELTCWVWTKGQGSHYPLTWMLTARRGSMKWRNNLNVCHHVSEWFIWCFLPQAVFSSMIVSNTWSLKFSNHKEVWTMLKSF